MVAHCSLCSRRASACYTQVFAVQHSLLLMSMIRYTGRPPDSSLFFARMAEEAALTRYCGSKTQAPTTQRGISESSVALRCFSLMLGLASLYQPRNQIRRRKRQVVVPPVVRQPPHVPTAIRIYFAVPDAISAFTVQTTDPAFGFAIWQLPRGLWLLRSTCLRIWTVMGPFAQITPHLPAQLVMWPSNFVQGSWILTITACVHSRRRRPSRLLKPPLSCGATRIEPCTCGCR